MRNASAHFELLKKTILGLFQCRKPKMKFPPCSQNQGLKKLSSILVAHPWAPQAVFQQPVIPRPCRISRHFRKGLFGLARLSLAVVLLSVPPGAPGSQAAEAEPAVAEQEIGAEKTACFDRVWDAAHDHPWYLDAEGRQIVPEVARDWLIVRFFEPATKAETAEFFNRYSEAFAEMLETPDPGARTIAYRLRQGLPYGLFDALLQRWRDDPQVHSIQPAWRIEERLFAPLDQVEVQWKTTTDQATRHRLLTAAGALPGVTGKGPKTALATIDPCRSLAWQAAALLAEDLYVARAVPLKVGLEPPVTIQLQLDLPGATVGMAIPFRLEIRFTEGIKIESATIANLNLSPGGIFPNLFDISFDQPLSAIDLSRSPIRISGKLRLYASGDHLLPAIPVFYTDRRTGNGRPATLRTESTPVRIAAMVPETAGTYRLQVAAPPTLPAVADSGTAAHLRSAAAVTLAGVLLLALGATLWWRSAVRRTERNRDPGQMRLLEQRKAVEARLKGDPASMEAADWAALGEALQSFLADYAGLPTTSRGGSHASFLPCLQHRLSGSAWRQAAELLQGIEHLLAADHLDLGQRRALLRQAETLLADLTLPGDNLSPDRKAR